MENDAPCAVLDIVTLGIGVVLLDVGGMRLWQHVGRIGKLVLLSASLSTQCVVKKRPMLDCEADKPSRWETRT